jgi:hypothetical protein
MKEEHETEEAAESEEEKGEELL